ncbi:MAG: exosortase A [Allosphingosinicella sp.]
MISALTARGQATTPWQLHLSALALVSTLLLTLFAADAGDIVAIWWNSATFNHCLLIPPLIAWLVWQRLPELREIKPVAWAPGLTLVAFGSLGWLLGEASGVAFARHLGLVMMLQGAVISCLGPAVARGLAFPLAYALFLVPFGEELVPAMQKVTAEIATFLLALAGVPAHLEGIFITTSSGYFEVAEACAGVKFLIAMIAFGALVANVCFRSWRRRAAFMTASLIIPIFANGVRAWGTIYIAQLTSVEFAAGFDHVIYGGIFFAIVIAAILAVGWPFFDRGVDDAWLDRARLPDRAAGSLPWIAATVLGLAALAPIWSSAVSAAGTSDVPASFTLPSVAGWVLEPAGPEWRPNFAGADRIHLGRYRDPQGRAVDLGVAVFARQSEGRELVGYGQGAAGPESGWAWTGDTPSPLGGRGERIASHGVVREVLSFYRVGTITTGSGMGVKLETLKTRLLGGPQRAVAVLVSSPAPATGVSPRAAIDDFLIALGPVGTLADRASGLAD